MRISRRRFLELTGTSALAAAWGCRGGAALAPESDVAELIARQENPFNAEPALEKLAETWITPLRSFYVRTHGTVPSIDPATYRLRVEGLVERPLSLGLEELTDGFARSSVPATLQCAGNRRNEHSRTKKVPGVAWDAGAIGNAEWSGARLAELLQRAGVKGGARHACFTSLDECTTAAGKTPFGVSIPIEKAMAPETLVATGMNGRPLSPRHGFPARALVPGWIGGRSVKWLGSIVVSEKPSDNYYHAKDYKIFPPDVTPEAAKWDEAAPLGPMPTSSAICSPMAGETVKAGRLRVRGYALAATGRSIAKVEVSADGGRTWTAARVEAGSSAFSWNLWTAEVGAGAGQAVLAVRATDSSGAVQPEQTPWNFKGYLYSGWHRIPVTIS